MSAYALNRLLYDLRHPANRDACRRDPAAYYRRYDLSTPELALLLRQDWAGLLAAGASIYALTKLAATLGTSLLEMGAALRGMTTAQLQAALREQDARHRPYALLLD